MRNAVLRRVSTLALLALIVSIGGVLSAERPVVRVTPEAVAQQFIRTHRELGMDRMTLGEAQPVYNPAVYGVAYWEFDLLEPRSGEALGYVMVSATEADFPVVEFSHDGPSNHRILSNRLHGDDFSVWRYGPGYVAAESQDGRLLAETGARPRIWKVDPAGLGLPQEGTGSFSTRNPLKSGEAASVMSEYALEPFSEVPASYEEFKKAWRPDANRLEPAREAWGRVRAQLADGPKTMAAGEWVYHWVYGTATKYTQIPPDTAPNNTSCYSGCGATAWANMFGWWELNRGKANLIDGTAPVTYNSAGVKAMTLWVRNEIGTLCTLFSDQAPTPWWNEYKGARWAGARGYGYAYEYYWRLTNATSGSDLRRIAYNESVAGRPCIVGYNSDMHYGVSFGTAYWSTDFGNFWVWLDTCWGPYSSTPHKWIYLSDILNTSAVTVY